MQKSKSRVPPSGGKSRDLLTRADTAATATSVESQVDPIPRRQRGERVAAPTAELLGSDITDWGKVGTWVAIGAFAFGVVVTVIWNYADMVNSIRNLNDDVKDLKRKTDDLFRSSVDATARISSIERRTKDEPANTVSPAASSSAMQPRKP